MISLPSGTRIWLVAGATDMRKSFNGLGEQIQHVLDENPFSCSSSVAAGVIPSKFSGQMRMDCASSPNALRKGSSSGPPCATARWQLVARNWPCSSISWTGVSPKHPVSTH